jgi:hypothetical protein
MVVLNDDFVLDEEAPALAETSASDGARGARIAGPLFILAPSYSFTSIVCAMLGQHPQMYGLPELHLFGAGTMAEWWQMCQRTRWRSHGALRAVAQLYFGGQTDETIEQARGWLRRRSHLSTGMFLELLGRQVQPRMLVEKSPSITKSVDRMKRARRMFPGARYVHLLRHPRTQGESTIRHRQQKRQRRRALDQHWLEPPAGWYANHTNICEFLASGDESHFMRVRGEDFLAEPDRVVRSIMQWLGFRTDSEAIEEVMHPERSAYACPGPRGAIFGYNRNFLDAPHFRAAPVKESNLDDPLSWSSSGECFSPWVKKMAREFGYR